MPEMHDDEVLVRGVRSLLSPGSELKRVRRWPNAYTSWKWPNHNLGYAMSGVVEEIGADVEGIKPGDRVNTGGPHQQYVVAKGSLASRTAVPLPDDMDWDLTPFVLWGQSCTNWMRRANIRHSESVAVVGCGLVGLLMTMWSKLSSPRTLIAIDLFEKRLELARKAGADVVLNAGEGDVVEKVEALTDGGSDVTLHCVGGGAVKSFEISQRITRRGGRVILIGHHAESLTILPHQFTGKDLLGANVGYERNSQCFLDGLRLIQAGKLPVGEIVTHKVPYTEGPKIYDMLINSPQEAGAVLLEW